MPIADSQIPALPAPSGGGPWGLSGGGNGGGVFTPQNVVPAASGPNIWQFAIAIVVLYLIVQHVPHGETIAVLVTLGVFLSTPAAVNGVTYLLSWIENPLG